MSYEKTTWVDRVLDGSGNVITTGTPLSALKLNNIENGIANSLEKTGGTITGNLTTTGSGSFGTTLSATGVITASGGLTIPSGKTINGAGDISIVGSILTSGNIFTTGTGTITSGGLINANGGLTVPTGKSLTVDTGGIVSLPANSITNTFISSVATSKLTGTITNAQIGSNAVTQSKISAGAVGNGELKTAVDTSFSGTLYASATSGSLLGGFVSITTTYPYAFFPNVIATSQVMLSANTTGTNTNGQASFGLRNSATSTANYTVYIRYITA